MYLTEEQNDFFLQNEGLVFYLANEFNKKYYGFSIPELVALAGVGVMKATKHFKPESGYKFATFASTCAENEVRMALRAKQKFNRLESCSIDDTVYSEDDSFTIGDMLHDSKVDIEEEALRNEQFDIIYKYLDTLPERERLVFMLHHSLKGYPYKTQSELAKIFGLSQSYIARIRQGVEEGLREFAKTANTLVKDNKATKKSRKRYTDHLGIEFDTFPSMLKFHGVKQGAYYNRRKQGLSLEECLTPRVKVKPKKKTKPRVYKDHLGNEFSSMQVMLEYYGVGRGFYYTRLAKGKPLEVCLGVACMVKRSNTDFSNRGRKSKSCEDHLGNKFTSIKAMLQHHGVKEHVFYERKRSGISLEECLSPERKKRTTGDGGRTLTCTDHLGNHFDSVTSMLKYHKVNTSTYYRKKGLGLSLEECLSNVPVSGKSKRSKSSNNKSKITKPKGDTNKGNSRVCFDHLGTKFTSVSAMLEHHGVDKNTYYKRKTKGFSLDICLSPVDTIIPEDKHKNKPCKDHNGKEFNSVMEMVEYHGVSQNLFYTRKNKGFSLEECLSPHRLERRDYKVRKKQLQANQEIELTQDVIESTDTLEKSTPNSKSQKTVSNIDTKHRILNIVYEDLSARVYYLDETTNTVQNLYIPYDSPVWYSSETTSTSKLLHFRGIEVFKICI